MIVDYNIISPEINSKNDNLSLYLLLKNHIGNQEKIFLTIRKSRDKSLNYKKSRVIAKFFNDHKKRILNYINEYGKENVYSKFEEEIEKIWEELISLENQSKTYNENYEDLSSTSENLIEDHRLKRIAELDEENEQLTKINNSPSTLREKHKHEIPMLSLDKSLKISELKKWIKKQNSKGYIFQPKYDGLAVSVHYKNGKYFKAVTRGDGSYGDVITENMINVQQTPEILNESIDCEVRGEVLILNSDFEKIEIENKEETNPRNLAAGSLKLKDSEKVKERYLTFVAYDVHSKNLKFQSELQERDWIESQGFFYGLPGVLCNTFEEIEKEWNKLSDSREKLDFEIDGAVIKINDKSEQEELGFTSHHPRWAIAQKFEPKGAVTKVISIDWQVGRTGVLTPVANLEARTIGDVIVKRATLHNISEIEKHDIKIGSLVEIVRSGDVIPKLIRKVKDMEDSSPLNIPTHCPSCNFPITRDGLFLKCLNSNCSKKKIQNLIHFVETLEIESVGGKWVEILNENKLLENRQDLYELTKEKLLKLDRIKEKLAEKILFSINEKKNIPLELFIQSLGIPSIGKNIAGILRDKFGTLENIYKNLNINDLISIEGVSEITANQIIEGLNNEKENISKLLEYITLEEGIKQNTGGIFEGKSFCITGTLIQFKEEGKSRKDIEKIIIENGGNIKGISKELDTLIVGEKAGSKLDKAKKLGISIMTEKELRNKLGI